MAREGMTGPCQPFEGRHGLFDNVGPLRNPRLPAPSPDGRLLIERMGHKRFPSEGSTQSILEVTPAIRTWLGSDEVASIHVELPFAGWQETADPPKWDPKNRETADHSMPYVIAIALVDGEVYLDSFTPTSFGRPKVKRLAEKITVSPNFEYRYQGQSRLTIRTRSGRELVKETDVHMNTPMTHEEILVKFNRVCATRFVRDDQRDRLRATWSDLRKVKDIADPIRDLAHFGRPQPL
jgi:2-methylcitrate dehydratase